MKGLCNSPKYLKHLKIVFRSAVLQSNPNIKYLYLNIYLILIVIYYCF